MWTIPVGLLVYAVCAVRISSAQVPWFVDSYEGTDCRTPSGAPGVCKQTDECLVTLPNPAPVSEDSDGRPLCGSLGPSALVCCDARPGDVTTTTTTTTASPNLVTTSGQVVTVAEAPRSPVGEKSARYCLSVIPYNRQPWWLDDGLVEVNEVEPWWEEREEHTVQKKVFWKDGGVQAYNREFPHMALLGYLAPGQQDISWRCGGSLISDRFVLTARHCFADKTLQAPIVVRLGENDLTTNERTEQDFGIDQTWFHPRDQPGSCYHDLALVRLNRRVKFSRVISPACLYSIPEEQERRHGLMVAGWGTSPRNDTISRARLTSSAPLSVVSRNECAKYYRQAKSQVPNGIHPGMVCAVDRAGYEHTCPGDSGGPIQLPTTFDVHVIVGVISGGVRHCGDGTPTIYTRVAYYLDWIENIVWPNGVE